MYADFWQKEIRYGSLEALPFGRFKKWVKKGLDCSYAYSYHVLRAGVGHLQHRYVIFTCIWVYIHSQVLELYHKGLGL